MGRCSASHLSVSCEFLSRYSTQRRYLTSFIFLFLLSSWRSSSLPISSEAPRYPPPPGLPSRSSFYPPPPSTPHHPSNVGGQQNNIQGVTVTGSPLPALSSCHCPRPRLPLWLLHSIKRTHTLLHRPPHPPPPTAPLPRSHWNSAPLWPQSWERHSGDLAARIKARSALGKCCDRFHTGYGVIDCE